MRITRFISISIAGLFVMMGTALADSSASDSPSPADSPNMQVDPDGVPLNLQQDQPEQLSQDEIDLLQKEQQRARQNKNWLLRGYMHQLETHAGTTQGLEGNLYYQLTTNKELAKLAGLPALDQDDQSNLNPNKTGISPAASSSGELRPDSSPPAKSGSTTDYISSPMMKPLNSATFPGMTSIVASLPFAMPSPLAANYLPAQTPAPTPAPAGDDQSTESSDLNMPGMVASKSTLNDPTDSTLDVLPGETIQHARDHQDDNNSLLELPLAMDADQLHKTQAATLTAPPSGALPKTVKTDSPITTTVKPIQDQEAPMPVDKTPAITPIRSPIANPFDILNR